MTNAELIKALRYCTDDEKQDGCDECPYLHNGMCHTMLSDAADALEAAEAYEEAWTKKCERLERRIAELEAQLLLLKEGEWISDYDGFEYDVRCSVCGEEALIKEGGSHDHAYSHYCPNCGAKMRGEKR